MNVDKEHTDKLQRKTTAKSDFYSYCMIGSLTFNIITYIVGVSVTFTLLPYIVGVHVCVCVCMCV